MNKMQHFTASEEEPARKRLIDSLYEGESIIPINAKLKHNTNQTPNNLIIGNVYKAFKIKGERCNFQIAIFCEKNDRYRYRYFFNEDDWEIIFLN